MKEKIFKNFSLKILSIIGAILLWGIIVNIYDPNTGVTISNVTVQLINTESLTDKGYTYEVVDGSKISVYVSGPKSIIADIKASDIIATADLSNISAFADYVDIDVSIEKDGRLLQNVEVTPKTTAVQLNIENRVTQSFDVKVEMVGTGASGYVVFNDTISPSSIKVTGPSSAIQKIAQVKAVYDISAATSDISDTATVVLYDSDGNVIDDPQLELSKQEVRFQANMGYSKTVDIIYQTSGTPADGYELRDIEAEENVATIYGNVKTVNSINEIEIPASVLNIDGLKADKEYKIWLSDYLPDGITVASANYVNVNVIIDKKFVNESTTSSSTTDNTTTTPSTTSDGQNNITLQLTLTSSDIVINGVSEGTTASIVMTTPLSVNILCASNIVNSLTAAQLGANIDVTGLSSGTHQLDIKFNLPDGISVSGSYMVTVSIEEQETTATTTEQITTSAQIESTQAVQQTIETTTTVSN